MTHPPGGPPGQPDTEPVPIPEPDPPTPIPPTEPVPAPEPPHVADAPPQAVDAPAGDQTAQFRPVAEQPTSWLPAEQPWHAQHEKSGEWRTHPPDHLAHEHSPPFQMQNPPPPQWQAPPPPPATDDRRNKTGLWVSVALTTTVLLCGGGAFSAYLLLREADGSGAPDPASAVNEFMTAIYTRQDAAAANGLVCRESRDKEKLAARVNQIKEYANVYDGPSFDWEAPAVSGQSEERATVSVQLTMSTDDEKTAQQKLTFTTVRKSGWLVCEIAG